MRFTPTDDTYVSSQESSENYGTRDYLGALAAHEYRPYVRFSVTDLVGPVTDAVLRLYVVNGTDTVGGWYDVDPSWSETTLTWADAPAITGEPLEVVGGAATFTWIEVDVTAAVEGNGEVSFANLPASTNRVNWSSKEGLFPPELVVSTTG